MSTIIKPPVLDETAKLMLERMDRQNALLSIIAADKKQAMYDSMAQIADIVRGNTVEQNEVLFPIGSKITIPWVDKSNNDHEYMMPFNVVHHKMVELADGSIVPGMFLQSHYATVYGVQFSHYQAFYYAATALPAGDYHITIGTTWGNKECVAGTNVAFTLTQELPVGGRLAGMYQLPDKASSEWKIYAYAADGVTLLETMNATIGDSGTSLGTMYTNKNDEGLNFMHAVSYGYGRWSQAAIRQWLNSGADIGAWWKPQSNYDIAPDQLATKPGFLSGFSDDFLGAIRPIKVQTATNTLTDGGVTDVTYDRFFCPSVEEIFCTPQISGIEGEAWDYWKQALARTTPAQCGTDYKYDAYIHHALENPNSAQAVRLRSAYRTYGGTTWYVSSTGYVYYGTTAYGAIRCAPACVIC